MPPPATPDPNLVVSVEELVRGLPGVTYSSLTEAQYAVLADAIMDATADVEAYLGRPVMPVTRTEYHRWPYGDGWDLDPGDEPRDSIVVVSSTPELDEYGAISGYFTVVYRVGLNAKTDPELRPIRRFIRYHAQNAPEVVEFWSKTTKSKGRIKSSSAEGQSVSYESPNLGVTGQKPGDGSPGSPPTMRSLDRWRLAGRRVHVAKSQTSDWPFYGRRW